MRLFIFAFLCATMMVAVLIGPSYAQEPRCAPHADLSAALARMFSETVVAMGLAGNGQMVEVYASPRGTWTIAFTTPTGVSCMVSSGAAFEQIIANRQPQGVPG